MDESSPTQNRRSRRSNVLMAAFVECAGARISVKLRNLSQDGALVEGVDLPPVGTAVRFFKGELALPGQIAWAAGKRAGIAFDQQLDPESVLRHIPKPMPRQPMGHRRPPIRGHELSAGERKIAEDWIFGTPLPGIAD